MKISSYSDHVLLSSMATILCYLLCYQRSRSDNLKSGRLLEHILLEGELSAEREATSVRERKRPSCSTQLSRFLRVNTNSSTSVSVREKCSWICDAQADSDYYR
ncbi:PREDICTED: uncharacterized protein LOC105451732 [Wasmannia auropunctata]|uniref:uncharacterized protein LOC105451732 n=1 Tax=Wasmannia auropunctata TaxID=64793 RepID=UPI0005F023D8|nr:PREDICTED: uncharacterized protein LOC105451732 [Wasmannia auropunctata]